MASFLPPLLVVHLLERQEILIAQLFILWQVLEQEQSIAPEDAVDEGAERRCTGLVAAARGMEDIARLRARWVSQPAFSSFCMTERIVV
jgi:hypothetical protein